MLWLFIVLRFVHVLCGILWFGSVMTLYLFNFPAQRKLDPEAVKMFMANFQPRYRRVIIPVAGLTVLFGLVIGIVTFATSDPSVTYKATWALSLVLGVLLIINGARVLGPTAASLATAPASEQPAVFRRIDALGRRDLTGFGLLFACMIAMHFGY